MKTMMAILIIILTPWLCQAGVIKDDLALVQAGYADYVRISANSTNQLIKNAMACIDGQLWILGTLLPRDANPSQDDLFRAERCVILAGVFKQTILILK